MNARTTPRTSVFKRLKDSRVVRIDPADREAVAWAKARIAQLYVERSETPAGTIKSNRRFLELEIVFAHLWRGRLPADDAGRDCLYIAACHLWHLGRRCGADAAIRAWAAIWAPWCGLEELAALIQRVEANPRKWNADEMPHELGPWLTFAVRQSLGLTTIGSIDVDKAARVKRRQDRKRQEREEHRRNNGVVPRAEYLAAHSKSREEPWKQLGMSKSRYYRLGLHKASETGPCTPKRVEVLVSTHLSHGIDLGLFGIVAITVMRGQDIVARLE
ncbi:hypothetical protein Q2941_49745 [Bradyrhizobium sp. UFLA05-153]